MFQNKRPHILDTLLMEIREKQNNIYHMQHFKTQIEAGKKLENDIKLLEQNAYYEKIKVIEKK